MYVAQLRAALATIHARWEHGDDGITPGCSLCADEQAEAAALTAVSYALAPRALSEPAPARETL